jgi:hypothetical protein
MEAVDAARRHAALVSTCIVLAVDRDDPTLPEYQARFPQGLGGWLALVILEPDETGDLVRATNTIAMRIAATDRTAIIGNLGDDHLIRTPGWDRMVAEALERPGIAYGDDLLQGAALPTAPFISAEIVNALGWFFMPRLVHMYPDNVAKDLGEALGVLRYLPEFVVEHMHPGAGKAEQDAHYRRADSSTERDRQAYHAWRQSRLKRDAATVRRALAL